MVAIAAWLLLLVFGVDGQLMNTAIAFGDGMAVWTVNANNVGSVYLAGSWNNWANNSNGYVSDSKFQMTPFGNGLWKTAVPLPYGQWFFKIVTDNNRWWSPSGFPLDNQGNAIFWIDDQGVSLQNPGLTDSKNPHWSFPSLPFSNGYSASKFNVFKGLVDTWDNHIFQRLNSNTTTVSLIDSIDFSIQANGHSILLSALNIQSLSDLGYIPNTGMVQLTAALPAPLNGGVTATFWSSFLKQNNNLNVVVSVGLSGSVTVTPIVTWNPSIHVVHVSQSTYTSTLGDITFNYWNSGNDFTFSLDHFPLAGDHMDALEGYVNSDIKAQELDFWNSWFSRVSVPPSLDDDEENLYRQSLVVLKMAQCREKISNSHGQILASLPPGMWNICWVRDGSYAIVGMVNANLMSEAKDALSFFLNAKVGKYQHFYVNGIDYGVGVPYQVSVCRYYGDGTEWSDGDNDPNIELDGFGLLLWALDTYVTQSKDFNFLKQYWPIISGKISDVLVKVIDPSLQLIKPDSSIWERHIIYNPAAENGALHFTYTTLTAIKGLHHASHMASLVGDTTRATKYTKARAILISGFQEQQVDPQTKIIKDSWEKKNLGDQYVDASVIEAINWEIVDASSEIAQNTLAAFDKYLSLSSRPGVGYVRNQQPGWYDKQEWIVMDLRIAAALKKINPQKAESLTQWVVGQSKENYNIMAELYDSTNGNYTGAVPMCGFGPGAYLIYCWA